MAKSNKLKAVPQTKPVFNPQVSYQWKAEDVFPITGQQLDIVSKFVNAYLQTEEGQKAVLLVEAAKVMQVIIREGVEEGIITPTPPAQPTENS